MPVNAYITVNGVPFPYPNKESGLQTQSTFVSSGRNVNGVVIGQRVGRDQVKVELQWKRMDAQLWAGLLQIFQSNFMVTVSYYDMTAGKILSRRMYVGDRTARPGRVDPATGVWLEAKDCKLNLIDVGEGD